jgi:peptide/nickel transport system substrate-binding protein
MTLITTGRLNRRRFLQTTAATAMAASLPLSGAMAAPKRGGHLRIGKGHGQTTDTLNPGTWSNGFTIGMSFGVHGRLTEIAADGALAPEVAESWDPSADASEWTFNIRKGMTFHNGKEVTADDVAASINFHRGEDSTSAAGPLVAAIQDIVVNGSHSVTFKLDGGNADFPVTLSDYHLPIIPAKDDSIDWESGIGCGSYVLKSHNFGVSVEMERNPNHWRDSVGWFDSIEILALVDQNARTAALVSGDVQLVDRLDLKTVGLLARNQDLNIHSIAGNQHYTLPMTGTTAPFDNNHVRQALKLAINREELVEKILFGYGSIGNDHPIGTGQRFFNTDLEQISYDPDKAKWHLKEAGMDSISIDLSASEAAFGGAVDAAILFQNSAKAAGIDIKVTREPNDGYWSDVWMKKPFTMSYWSGRVVEDQMFATAYSCGAAWNESFFCHDRFEELMLKARSELDDDKRRTMYYEMQEICAHNSGEIIPMFANYVFATSKAIGTPEVMGTNWDLDGERWSERWWFA